MMRQYIRDQWFRLFRDSVCHSEGKAAIAESLRGLLHHHADAASTLSNTASPYENIGQPISRTSAWERPFVVVTGRFRSGSTLLWNLFRQADDVTAYYEPLNERRWFDRSRRSDIVDATHRGVTNYWQEYDGLDELAKYYREEWTHSRLYMDQHAWEPDLQRYIECLVTSTHRTAVLQFNRIDFRLPWITHQFPDAKIVHIMRHPRDQWVSTLGVPRSNGLPSFGPTDGNLSDFAPHDKYYLNTWVADLRYWFPFLDQAAEHHPYRSYYLLWKLSYMFARIYADVSIRFEDLVSNPRAVLGSVFDRLELSIPAWEKLQRLIETPSMERWKAYASNDWFCEHESQCESQLNEYLHTMRGENFVGTQRSSDIGLIHAGVLD